MNEAEFFRVARGGLLGPTLSQSEVDGCKAILLAMGGASLSHCAYALATAYHETAGTMQPIKEYGSHSYFMRRYDPTGANPKVAKQLGNTVAGDGAAYAGRGYVQLTGRANYAKAGRILGVDLIGTPDIAMRHDIAAKVLRRGMDEGWFTGKKFSDYLPDGPATVDQFAAARRIINGVDKARTIAGHAVHFQVMLQVAGWGSF